MRQLSQLSHLSLSQTLEAQKFARPLVLTLTKERGAP